MILDKLNFPVNTLKGIGKYYTSILNKNNIFSVADLLEYFPRTFSDRTKIVSLREALKLNTATVKVKIIEHRFIGKNNKQFLKILIYDGESYGALVCFGRNFLKDNITIGKYYYITGKWIFNYGEIQSTNFETEEVTDDYKPRILPIYPLKEGLSQNVLRNAIEDGLKKFRLDIENELPVYLIEKRGLLPKREALKNVHFPENFSLYYQAKKTFIYEEFFFQKLFLLNRKRDIEKIKKNRPKIQFLYKKKVLENLNFKLTDYQEKALQEIENDLFSNKITSRLLQGDVGSGKTIVAILAMLSLVEAGYQCAFMVPTEVLANQHYNNLKKLISDLNIDISILKGNMKKKEKIEVLKKIRTGETKIIIGTHSLFSEDVIYKNLGFVVIDEQHRFGVEQRMQLLSKGTEVDLLLMTATPIPQSLSLALYGDLDFTIMKGKISGRIPVKTWLIDDNQERLNKMNEWIKTQIKDNGRAIFVYSLIEDNELSEKKDLKNQYQILSSIYNNEGCGLIHSKLSNDKKQEIMEDFKNGTIKVLLATTVIEVGIDVPEANIIVVENAENYGLSTLHQLRGRVGRNNKPGYMILITKIDKLTEEGKKRLEIIVKENDGFKIAEEDLLLRGPGDFIGSKQSGLPEYKFADIREDMEILKEASLDADFVFNNDPELKKPEHYCIKNSYLNRLKNYIKNYNF